MAEQFSLPEPTFSDSTDDIEREITKLLEIDRDDDETATEILKNLLQKGRQSLSSYQDDIIGIIYEDQMKEGSKLLQLLMQYHRKQWKDQYDSKFLWFRSLIEEIEREASDLYNDVLTRTAEHGDRYMKSCPLLSIVIQLLFKPLGADDMSTVFDNIWDSLTNDGLQSITQYSNYILPEIMGKQLEKLPDQRLAGPLFMALREFYREQLFQFLRESKVVDRGNLYEQTLNFVAEHGWVTGVRMIEKLTTKKNFDVLMGLIQELTPDIMS